jgi:threonine/homoserine/homoserine lactone efflux protein
VSRLRAGEWTAALGGAGLLVSLFLPWFVPLEVVFVPTGQISGNAESGWSSLGWVTLAFCLAAIAVAAWLAVANATNRPVAQAVAASVLTATVGTVAFVALALRVLVVQPGPNALTTIRYGAYLGLLAALILAIGGWLAIKDERTDAPESAYTPPDPRPPPPARAA